jgi:CheY-like chemotaxis protein
LKALIVEDDPTSARTYQYILEKRAGLAATICDDGDEAVSIVSQGLVDLVLVDQSLTHVRLGGLTVAGDELTRRLKGDPLTCDVPVVLLSARILPGEEEDFRRSSGADAVLAKPLLGQDLLIQEVRRLLARSNRRS